jgi:DNA-binding GntR family transcriptional regulator
LVLFKPNSGTVVRQWTPDQVHEIFELRVLLESEIAAHGARRISGAEIDELLRLQDDIETGGTDVSSENTARVGRLNREFHRVIAQASRHERLVSMLANAIEVPIVQQTFRRYTARQLARSFGHHRELIDAFRAHDGEWARSVMSSHSQAGPARRPAVRDALNRQPGIPSALFPRIFQRLFSPPFSPPFSPRPDAWHSNTSPSSISPTCSRVPTAR